MILQNSKYANIISTSNGLFCISHSILQQQIFGDARLKKVYNLLKQRIEKKIFINNVNTIYNKRIGDALYKKLKKNNYLEDGIDASFKNVSLKSVSQPKGYKLLRILLTDTCNLACRYCKVMLNLKKEEIVSTNEIVLLNVVKEFFRNSDPHKPKVIHITGGEPLIFWYKVKYIINQIKIYKRKNEIYYVCLGTNGLLLDQDKINYIKENHIKVIVSLDGRPSINDTLRRTKNQKGSYKYIDRALKELIKNNIDIGISMVIGGHNVKTLEKEIGFIIDKYKPISLGINYMKPPTKGMHHFQYLISPKEYVDSIYEVYKKYRHTGVYFELLYRKLYPFVERQFRLFDCGATAGTTINVDAYGRVGPCKSFLLLDTILSSNIDAKGPSLDCRKILHCLERRSPLYKKQCETCKAIAICGNGCAYEAWISTGSLMGIDIHACEYSKYFIDKFIDDLSNILYNKIKKLPYYIPSMRDRRMLYGSVKLNEENLNSSIGHEIST